MEDEDYKRSYCLFKEMKEISDYFFSNQKRIIDRLDSIEKMINDHSIGVQNVYNSIQDLRSNYTEINKFTKTYKKIRRFCDFLNKPENVALLKIIEMMDWEFVENVSKLAEDLESLERVKKLFKT